ncbi:MAG: 5'/3'-nucleotidase SurE [Bacteroidetes bacterium]|nr:MAG: 5'/3'-nucleotidase SurE [Bacteroidota bacterium]
MIKRPKILVTNDDGINAQGIRFLIDVVRDLGDVIVVAPDSPQSGMGHAITVNSPLRIKMIVEEDGYQEYSCNGTPVDCVKLGEQVVLKGKPDLLVSGINHGSNAAVNIVYSGTMAAAIEGCIDRIPSIGFSINDFSHNLNFEPTRKYIKHIAAQVLEKGLKNGICLNVNFPIIENIKGIKVTRQADACWREEFDSRIDPRGGNYYWLTGKFVSRDNGHENDINTMEEGYVSVVPVKIDLTAYNQIDTLKYLELNNEPK